MTISGLGPVANAFCFSDFTNQAWYDSTSVNRFINVQQIDLFGLFKIVTKINNKIVDCEMLPTPSQLKPFNVHNTQPHTHTTANETIYVCEK